MSFMKLISGKEIAKKIEAGTKKEIRNGARGGLAVVLVGNNVASRLYIRLKEKAAKRVGIKFEKYLYQTPHEPQAAKELEKNVINKIDELNSREDISGIIIQLPLPRSLNANKIIATIDPKKDADGFCPKNQESAISPVLQATIHSIRETGASLKKKDVLMISKSKIFPKPFKKFFENTAKSFTVCQPQDIKQRGKNADIVITAVGNPRYLKGKMIKNGVIIIDIGIYKKGKKIFGDTDPDSVKKKAAWLTPVPGGIGPITVACLIKNTVRY